MRVILFLLMSYAGFSQPVVKKLDKIPDNIKYTGKIINAVTWKDQSGEHVVITTETREPDGGSLYAYHFVNNTQLWRVYDGVKDCSFDITANFIKNSFAITDLDKNGKPEVWLMYSIGCYSDVAGMPAKIIMYEDNKKYATRGRTKVRVSETDFDGGEYTFDDAFKKAPATFRTYAEKLWKKFALAKQ